MKICNIEFPWQFFITNSGFFANILCQKFDTLLKKENENDKNAHVQRKTAYI